jgi:AcrR family transcriptional regulator
MASPRASVRTRARVRSGALGSAAPALSRKRPGEASSSAAAAAAASGGARVIEIQRSRLLAAASGVVDELGYSRTTVTHITQRARVSRRTFYDLFEDREDCVLAVFEDVVGLLRREVLAAAGVEGMDWRERVRAGLWTILLFLDREPVLARVCVVQALRSGTRALERREEILAELAGVLDEGRDERPRSGECTALTGEGLVGAVFGIVYGRLLRGEHAPLTDLFKELMGMIVLPYLGPAAARKEQARSVPTLVPAAAGSSGAGSESVVAGGGYECDPLADLPMRLTYRTARVIEVLAAHPGVSNRVVGECAGVADQGQISRLLARLERLGLVENTGEGHLRGEANAWALTEMGVRVARSIGAHSGRRSNSGGAA